MLVAVVCGRCPVVLEFVLSWWSDEVFSRDDKERREMAKDMSRLEVEEEEEKEDEEEKEEKEEARRRKRRDRGREGEESRTPSDLQKQGS